jgi:hypothetical protein
MADTKHHGGDFAGGAPVEGDGISYVGITWFVVILTATTVFCMVLVWGMFEWMDRREATGAVQRAPMAAPVGAAPPGPNLLTDEPGNLQRYRLTEAETLTTYGWVDQNAGRVRIPIDRAKALLLERGLPARDASAR